MNGKCNFRKTVSAREKTFAGVDHERLVERKCKEAVELTRGYTLKKIWVAVKFYRENGGWGLSQSSIESLNSLTPPLAVAKPMEFVDAAIDEDGGTMQGQD